MIPTFPRNSAEWLRKNVAILGRGESGQAAANLVLHLGGSYQFFCEDPRGGSQQFDSREAARYDLVIFSPGFSVQHPWISIARAVGCELMGELEFARQFWQGQVWVVSGTNGKTTTVSLLVHALKNAGKHAIAVGNIGYAFSRAVMSSDNQPGAIAVCEVSSFQSESFHRWSCDAGIWSHFAPNHLDRHGDMETYFKAKCQAYAGVPAKQLFLGKTVIQSAKELGLTAILPASAQPLQIKEHDSHIPVFFRTPAQIENFRLCASLFVAMGGELEQFYSSLKTFVPPAHRVAYVGAVRGVDFWNDSKATNSSAVGAALSQFPDRKIRWIGGGVSKGESLAQFGRMIASRVQCAYTIGTVGKELAERITQAGGHAVYCETLNHAVDQAFQDAHKGEVILLSPGFASFDQFRGYAERGECFQSKVFRLSSAQESLKTNNLVSGIRALKESLFHKKPEL